MLFLYVDQGLETVGDQVFLVLGVRLLLYLDLFDWGSVYFLHGHSADSLEVALVSFVGTLSILQLKELFGKSLISFSLFRQVELPDFLLLLLHDLLVLPFVLDEVDEVPVKNAFDVVEHGQVALADELVVFGRVVGFDIDILCHHIQVLCHSLNLSPDKLIQSLP